MNPERSSGAGEPPEPLVRVGFPATMIARARELGKAEPASVSQICRRALQKELDRMEQEQF